MNEDLSRQLATRSFNCPAADPEQQQVGAKCQPQQPQHPNVDGDNKELSQQKATTEPIGPVVSGCCRLCHQLFTANLDNLEKFRSASTKRQPRGRQHQDTAEPAQDKDEEAEAEEDEEGARGLISRLADCRRARPLVNVLLVLLVCCGLELGAPKGQQFSVRLVQAQCPWTRHSAELHSDCICNFIPGQMMPQTTISRADDTANRQPINRMSVQCAPVDFGQLLRALKQTASVALPPQLARLSIDGQLYEDGRPASSYNESASQEHQRLRDSMEAEQVELISQTKLDLLHVSNSSIIKLANNTFLIDDWRQIGDAMGPMGGGGAAAAPLQPHASANSSSAANSTSALGGLRLVVAIQALHLSRCSIEQIDPLAFNGLEWSLTSLSLADNRLQSVPREAVQRLINLRVLDLSNNQLHQLGARSFSRLGRLSALRLADNKQIGQFGIDSRAFDGLEEHLSDLNLKDTQLGEFPQAISRLKGLEFLNLAQNRISQIPPLAFNRSRWLTAINLERNRIVNIDEDTFLGAELSLSSLSLLGNLIEQFPVRPIGRLTALRRLDLGFNRIGRLPADAFQANKRLILIALDGNPLETLPELAFKPLESTLRGLSVGGKSLNCDCRLSWMLRWQIDHQLQVSSRERAPQFCAKPNYLRSLVSFAALKPEHLTCSPVVAIEHSPSYDHSKWPPASSRNDLLAATASQQTSGANGVSPTVSTTNWLLSQESAPPANPNTGGGASWLARAPPPPPTTTTTTRGGDSTAAAATFGLAGNQPTYLTIGQFQTPEPPPNEAQKQPQSSTANSLLMDNADGATTTTATNQQPTTSAASSIGLQLDSSETATSSSPNADATTTTTTTAANQPVSATRTWDEAEAEATTGPRLINDYEQDASGPPSDLYLAASTTTRQGDELTTEATGIAAGLAATLDSLLDTAAELTTASSPIDTNNNSELSWPQEINRHGYQATTTTAHDDATITRPSARNRTRTPTMTNLASSSTTHGNDYSSALPVVKTQQVFRRTKPPPAAEATTTTTIAKQPTPQPPAAATTSSVANKTERPTNFASKPLIQSVFGDRAPYSANHNQQQQQPVTAATKLQQTTTSLGLPTTTTNNNNNNNNKQQQLASTPAVVPAVPTTINVYKPPAIHPFHYSHQRQQPLAGGTRTELLLPTTATTTTTTTTTTQASRPADIPKGARFVDEPPPRPAASAGRKLQPASADGQQAPPITTLPADVGGGGADHQAAASVVGRHFERARSPSAPPTYAPPMSQSRQQQQPAVASKAPPEPERDHELKPGEDTTRDQPPAGQQANLLDLSRIIGLLSENIAKRVEQSSIASDSDDHRQHQPKHHQAPTSNQMQRQNNNTRISVAALYQLQAATVGTHGNKSNSAGSSTTSKPIDMDARLAPAVTFSTGHSKSVPAAASDVAPDQRRIPSGVQPTRSEQQFASVGQKATISPTADTPPPPPVAHNNNNNNLQQQPTETTTRIATTVRVVENGTSSSSSNNNHRSSQHIAPPPSTISSSSWPAKATSAPTSTPSTTTARPTTAISSTAVAQANQSNLVAVATRTPQDNSSPPTSTTNNNSGSQTTTTTDAIGASFAPGANVVVAQIMQHSIVRTQLSDERNSINHHLVNQESVANEQQRQSSDSIIASAPSKRNYNSSSSSSNVVVWPEVSPTDGQHHGLVIHVDNYETPTADDKQAKSPSSSIIEPAAASRQQQATTISSGNKTPPQTSKTNQIITKDTTSDNSNKQRQQQQQPATTTKGNPTDAAKSPAPLSINSFVSSRFPKLADFDQVALVLAGSLCLAIFLLATLATVCTCCSLIKRKRQKLIRSAAPGGGSSSANRSPNSSPSFNSSSASSTNQLNVVGGCALHKTSAKCCNFSCQQQLQQSRAPEQHNWLIRLLCCLAPSSSAVGRQQSSAAANRRHAKFTVGSGATLAPTRSANGHQDDDNQSSSGGSSSAPAACQMSRQLLKGGGGDSLLLMAGATKSRAYYHLPPPTAGDDQLPPAANCRRAKSVRETRRPRAGHSNCELMEINYVNKRPIDLWTGDTTNDDDDDDELGQKQRQQPAAAAACGFLGVSRTLGRRADRWPGAPTTHESLKHNHELANCVVSSCGGGANAAGWLSDIDGLSLDSDKSQSLGANKNNRYNIAAAHRAYLAGQRICASMFVCSAPRRADGGGGVSRAPSGRQPGAPTTMSSRRHRRQSDCATAAGSPLSPGCDTESKSTTDASGPPLEFSANIPQQQHRCRASMARPHGRQVGARTPGSATFGQAPPAAAAAVEQQQLGGGRPGEPLVPMSAEDEWPEPYMEPPLELGAPPANIDNQRFQTKPDHSFRPTRSGAGATSELDDVFELHCQDRQFEEHYFEQQQQQQVQVQVHSPPNVISELLMDAGGGGSSEQSTGAQQLSWPNNTSRHTRHQSFHCGSSGANDNSHPQQRQMQYRTPVSAAHQPDEAYVSNWNTISRSNNARASTINRPNHEQRRHNNLHHHRQPSISGGGATSWLRWAPTVEPDDDGGSGGGASRDDRI